MTVPITKRQKEVMIIAGESLPKPAQLRPSIEKSAMAFLELVVQFSKIPL